MMCDQCKVRKAERGSVFCHRCGRWEAVGDLVGVAGLLLGIGALLLLADLLR